MLEEALDRDLQEHGLAAVGVRDHLDALRVARPQAADVGARRPRRAVAQPPHPHRHPPREVAAGSCASPARTTAAGSSSCSRPKAVSACSTSPSPTSPASAAPRRPRDARAVRHPRCGHGAGRRRPAVLRPLRRDAGHRATAVPRAPDPTGARAPDGRRGASYGGPPAARVRSVTTAAPGASVLRWACDNGVMTSSAGDDREPQRQRLPLRGAGLAGALRAGARGHPRRGELARSAPSAPSAARPASSPRRPGPWLTDVDGRRYVDLICSWGPMILGHAHPDVVAAVQDAATRGLQLRHAERERGRCSPRRSSRRVEPVQQVRLVNSRHRGDDDAPSAWPAGSPAASVVVKFAGCYHGHVDALLAAAGSGIATFGLPDSAGVPAQCRRRDDRAALQRRRRPRGRVRRARRRDRLRHHRGAAGQHGRRAAGARASPRRCAG